MKIIKMNASHTNWPLNFLLANIFHKSRPWLHFKYHPISVYLSMFVNKVNEVWTELCDEDRADVMVFNGKFEDCHLKADLGGRSQMMSL